MRRRGGGRPAPRRTTARCVATGLAALGVAGSALLAAPRAAGAQAAPPRLATGLAPAWELRAEGRWRDDGGRVAALGGASVRLDRTLRLALLAGGSVDPTDGARTAVVGEAHVRYLLDPFAVRTIGWYGAAGVGVRAEDGAGPAAYVVVLVGAEGPLVLAGRARLAGEVGVGDGLRVGLALRGMRIGQR